MIPYRGRGRGRGQGRGGRSNNMLPSTEQNIPLIGDWTTITRNSAGKLQQLPAPKPKTNEDIPSSSKTTSFKDIIDKEPPNEVADYYENPVFEDIMYIEEEDISISPNDGWNIKTRYLESRGYPGLDGKSRPLYEMLLLSTESITITHNYHNNNPQSFISFSKCYINKILTPREWGLNPNSEKAIKTAEGKYFFFNYWDYIQAFTLAFYYQNPKNKHSWFFSINPEISGKQIPNWFYAWWNKIGPFGLDILPKDLESLYKEWIEFSPLLSRKTRMVFGQSTCLFFTKFQIPWIWRWTITITRDKQDIPVLRRQFFYKWWNKIPQEELQHRISEIKSEIEKDKIRPLKQKSEEFFMDSLKDYYQKIYPDEDEDQIMVHVLDHMKNQFFKTFKFSQSSDTVSMDTSSRGSANFEDSQPIDGPSPEDFWDAMIHTMKVHKGID
jgi:hypothetical protein